MSASRGSSWKLAITIGLPVAGAIAIGVAAYLYNRLRSARTPSSEEEKLEPGVVACEYSDTFEEPTDVVSDVSSPRFVAMSENGDLFVTSSRKHCVYVFDSSGKYKATIGSIGMGELQFNGPAGITISGDVVYVTETTNHRVQTFTTDGKFIRSFGCFGSSDGEFNGPVGICIGPGGDIYVSDCGNDRVQVFHSDASFSHSFGGEAVKSPFGMAFSPDGTLHVAMYATDTVVVFKSAGVYVRKYMVKKPAGLAVDKAGFSIVSTLRNDGALSVLDPSGQLVLIVEDFDYPCGVALAEDGSVWLAERNKNRVLKF